MRKASNPMPVGLKKPPPPPAPPRPGGWQRSLSDIPKGEGIKTLEHYRAVFIRDQELILEQRDEINKLKMKINKLEQRK